MQCACVWRGEVMVVVSVCGMCLCVCLCMSVYVQLCVCVHLCMQAMHVTISYFVTPFQKTVNNFLASLQYLSLSPLLTRAPLLLILNAVHCFELFASIELEGLSDMVKTLLFETHCVHARLPVCLFVIKHCLIHLFSRRNFCTLYFIS